MTHIKQDRARADPAFCRDDGISGPAPRDPDFSAAWDEALERGLDSIEDEVMRRAKDGVAEPVYYRGAVVGETRRFSDPLAMFILRSKRRDERRST